MVNPRSQERSEGVPGTRLQDMQENGVWESRVQSSIQKNLDVCSDHLSGRCILRESIRPRGRQVMGKNEQRRKFCE